MQRQGGRPARPEPHSGAAAAIWGTTQESVPRRLISRRPTCFADFYSLIAQSVKNLPAMQETRVQFLGQEDPLEKEMAIHSSIFAWKIPWTEEHGGLHSMGSQK